MNNESRLATFQMWSNDPAYMREVLREVGMLRRMGMDVVLFLIEDGADMAFPEGIRRACRDPQEAEEIIRSLDDELGTPTTVLVCKKCYEERQCGDARDLGPLLQGISVDAFNHFIEEVLQADVSLSLIGQTQQRLVQLMDERIALAANRTLGVESDDRARRDQFLQDLQPLGPALGEKTSDKWTVAVGSQPTNAMSDRLPAQKL